MASSIEVMYLGSVHRINLVSVRAKDFCNLPPPFGVIINPVKTNKSLPPFSLPEVALPTQDNWKLASILEEDRGGCIFASIQPNRAGVEDDFDVPATLLRDLRHLTFKGSFSTRLKPYPAASSW